MAEKVYELVQFRAREALWQLSEKERNSLIEKLGRAREEAGGKLLANFMTCSSEWRGAHVFVYPDMEAFHKFQVEALQVLKAQRYWDVEVTLGFEPTA